MRMKFKPLHAFRPKAKMFVRNSANLDTNLKLGTLVSLKIKRLLNFGTIEPRLLNRQI